MSAIADLAGNTISNTASLSFVQQAADADGDGDVDFDDLLAFSQNFGLSGRTFSQGNFDYQSTVNFADLLLLSQNFGASIVRAPFAVSTPITASSVTRRPRAASVAMES